MVRQLGPIEMFVARFSVVAYVAAAIVIFREWGEGSIVWQAVAAAVMASVVGIVVGAILMLPIVALLGVARGDTPNPLHYELNNVPPALAILWACYLCARSFGLV